MSCDKSVQSIAGTPFDIRVPNASLVIIRSAQLSDSSLDGSGLDDKTKAALAVQKSLAYQNSVARLNPTFVNGIRDGYYAVASDSSKNVGSYKFLERFASASTSQQDATLSRLLSFILSPLFFIAIILCMGVWIYYLKAIAIKRTKRNQELRFELDSERNEKRVLLKKLRNK